MVSYSSINGTVFVWCAGHSFSLSPNFFAMNQIKLFLIAGITIILSIPVQAQLATKQVSPGIWQTFGDPLNQSQYEYLNGRLCNFLWKDLEPNNNAWDWTTFDNDLTSRTKDGLPVIFMVYTKEDAPDWIYNNGVPKVTITDNKGSVIGHSPYYADNDYKSFFKRMIQKVHAHIETLPSSVRSKIIAVQGCFGSTGDYISYDGNVPAQYELDSKQFLSLFQEFSQYYYDEYKYTNPKIYLLSNPRNQGSDAAIWVQQNCPGWLKTGSLGKAFQLNDEADKYEWLYPMINTLQAGDYIRVRSEMSGGTQSSGWWKEAPYKNLFAVLCYDIFWGLDWNNQGLSNMKDSKNDSAFYFFNKYAGQKDPAKSTNAMCALKDVLDAKDDGRFPAAIYGSVSKTNQLRYISIAAKYAIYGALLEDVKTATMEEMDNLSAKGTNDVGWNLLPGNYDRYLHQVKANETSIGYWNIQSADATSLYGKFGRGFDVASKKKALYFDVDDAFLSKAPLNGKYNVTIEVTYLDKGTGGWQLYYDAKSNSDKSSVSVSCKNTNQWKKATITLNDAYFGNKGSNASDFSIRSTSQSQNVIFSVVELSRPANFSSAAFAGNVDAIQTNTFANDHLLVNPNPVSNNFYIQAKNNALIQQIIIYNTSGQIVLQKQVSTSRLNINKNEMGSKPGMYFIKVFTLSGTYTTKIAVL
jgi:hypothetical protein